MKVRKCQQLIRRAMLKAHNTVGLILLLAVLIFAMYFAFVKGLDMTFDNRDRMLCESALVSGNKEWLDKCTCYYAGKDIKCLWR